MPRALLTQRKPREADCADAREMDAPSPFDQLLRSAAAQPEPQRLLFVFAVAALPDDATPAERDRFAAGGGGTLEPVICVDKGLDELVSFEGLVAESRMLAQTGPPGEADEDCEDRERDAAWQVVFAAGLSGCDGQLPSAGQVERALQMMVERVRSGMIGAFLALDRSGETLEFV